MVLSDSLALHEPADQREAQDLLRILGFVGRHANPFDRRIAEGHLTGSALVVSAARSGPDAKPEPVVREFLVNYYAPLLVCLRDDAGSAAVCAPAP